jgi:hypothetical protein
MFVAPGPSVEIATPGVPVISPAPDAMNAASVS